MTKDEKSEYDREYRRLNKERLRVKKKLYAESESGRAMQKRQREKNKKSGYANNYNKQPEQREKERVRRHIREDKLGMKECIICEKTKSILEFEHWDVCPDKRSYLCKECEKHHQETLGCKTRNVITAMVGRPYTSLKRKDIAKYPYLIEANKYLILLKQLTK